MPGDCAEGGYILGFGPDKRGARRAFLVDEMDGAWSPAAWVRGLTTVGSDGSHIDFVVCEGATACAGLGVATGGRAKPARTQEFEVTRS